MSSDSDQGGRTTTMVNLITDAMERCHRARANYREARQLGEDSGVGAAVSIEFHYAVLNYYDELKPLRSKPAVEDFWKEAEIWDEWNGDYRYFDEEDREWHVYKETEDGDPKVLECVEEDEEDLSPKRVDKFDKLWKEPIFEPVTGIDTLENYAYKEREGTRPISDAFGEREIPTVKSVTLAGRKLLTASHTLDDAAAKLGFAPDAPTPVELDPDPI